MSWPNYAPEILKRQKKLIEAVDDACNEMVRVQQMTIERSLSIKNIVITEIQNLEITTPDQVTKAISEFYLKKIHTSKMGFITKDK